jgi:PAS domain-containing protein
MNPSFFPAAGFNRPFVFSVCPFKMLLNRYFLYKMGSSVSVHDTTHGAVGIQEIYTMLSTQGGLRDSFLNFLTVEYGDDISYLSTPFDFTIDYEKKLKNKAQDLLTNVFVSPPRPTFEIQSALHATLEEQNLDQLSLKDIHFLKRIHENRKEILTIVTLGAFSAFLRSEIYQRWFWTHESPPVIPSSPFHSSFSQFRPNDFETFLFTKKSSSWFQTLCHSFDNLPISISIADSTQRQFPLIYANSAFLEMSGFALEEIIGKSNKFLQKNSVEESVGKVMTDTIAAGEPCRVFISNRRNDDTPYRSLLSMKPVHSLDGVYRLVIGMQFDVTNQFNSYVALCVANDIFRALPSTCPNDIIGEAKNALFREF